MKKKILIVSILTFTIIYLSSFTSLSSKKDLLVGVWMLSDYENGILKYVKTTNFKDKEPGIEFKSDRKMIKRQNSSNCGTPPIQYGNYKGFWKFTSDSTILISYDYRGYRKELDWKIIKLNNKNLNVKAIGYRSNRIY